MMAVLKKVSGSAISEVGVTASKQGAENNHAVDIGRAGAVDRAQMREKAHLHILNLGLGQALHDDVGDLLGGRMYSNQNLSVLAIRHSSSKKIFSVSPTVKNAVAVLVGCLFIMSGPILAGLGIIKG